MKETTKPAHEIIQDMLSFDAKKVWGASCAICSLSQNHERIVQILPYEEKIKLATKGINLGGSLAPNHRFLKKVFEILAFHKANKGCPCCLLDEDFNPKHVLEDGYVILVDTIYIQDSRYIDYYVVKCRNCGTMYQVEEREYHYPWWNWIVLDKN